MIRKYSHFSFLILFLHSAIGTAQLSDENPLIAVDSVAQKVWVDSVYNNMSVRQRIGQLFMIDLYSNKGAAHEKRVKQLVQDYDLGGIIFSKGGPVRQAHLTNQIQEKARLPLLIAMDAEWGLSMRLDSTYAFPYNMTLGATPGLESSYNVGKRIGEHSKRMGVHINFAPVVDVNTNPLNPIIGNRSFGEDKDNVTNKALAFMSGMQSTGTLACAKHFPGHGDTDQDSHKTLPTVDFTAQRIDSVELHPYKRLIKKGLASVMVAHLNIPSLESRAGYPSSLSGKVVTDILRERLAFKGLIFTDALNMKGASNYSEPGDIDLQAFIAGNDVLLFSEDAPKAINKIYAALESGSVSQQRLQHSVKKILRAKYIVGLNSYKPIDTHNLYNNLNNELDDIVYESSMSRAITVLKNSDSLLPLKDLSTKRIAYLQLGDDSGAAYARALNKYTQVDIIKADKLDQAINKLKDYNVVIIGFHRSDANPWKSYNLKSRELTWIYEIAREHRVILDLFVKPYALAQLKTITNIDAIIMSYQNSEWSQQLSAQILFGGRDAVGKLPVSAGEFFKVNDGLKLDAINRLSYGATPRSVGLDTSILNKIDSIAQHTIDQKGAPGMQVLIARKGKVVFIKNYGYHTYSKERPVTSSDIYDIASLTKIMGTLPLVMELEEQHILKLEDKLGDILPAYAASNKKDITLKEMLSHYAQLRAWIPFYKYTLDTTDFKPLTRYYSNSSKASFNVPVANKFFTSNVMEDTIRQRIVNSKLREKREYKYSDLPYYILKDYLENRYDKSLDELTRDHFYQSLGLSTMGYLPLKKFDKNRIVPTEYDLLYRNQLIHGYVHDQGAAMQGGIGGHAGIFSNANDVAVMMQMYLQDGSYGGNQYFKPETINKFNTCYYCEDEVRRGVGFDKPQLEEYGPTCGCVSMTSFGHSGFTGAYTWADPETEIVYVFLSNRIYPNADNKFLLKNNIRTNIQQLIYDAIID